MNTEQSLCRIDNVENAYSYYHLPKSNFREKMKIARSLGRDCLAQLLCAISSLWSWLSHSNLLNRQHQTVNVFCSSSEYSLFIRNSAPACLEWKALRERESSLSLHHAELSSLYSITSAYIARKNEPQFVCNRIEGIASRFCLACIRNWE